MKKPTLIFLVILLSSASFSFAQIPTTLPCESKWFTHGLRFVVFQADEYHILAQSMPKDIKCSDKSYRATAEYFIDMYTRNCALTNGKVTLKISLYRNGHATVESFEFPFVPYKNESGIEYWNFSKPLRIESYVLSLTYNDNLDHAGEDMLGIFLNTQPKLYKLIEGKYKIDGAEIAFK